jgi:NAD(P)-dependent dehydrogenase (short-subunit alcohol dehydrogenase family)
MVHHSGANMKPKKWDSENISDQKGNVVIVTGSSSGLGFETANVLASKKATVIVAVRDEVKGVAAVEKIKVENPNADVQVMLVDLADLESVHKFAENFKKKFTKLDLLINNAGVMNPPCTKTKDGFELQFGTNHLGHFALTGLLVDLIKETPDSRVVNVSSTAHKIGKLNFDDLNWETRRYNKFRSYGDSKLANLYFTSELQKRLDEQSSGVIVASAHPGASATELSRHSLFFRVLSLFVQDSIMGALPTLYAAVAPDVQGNDYYGPGGFQEFSGYPKKVESTKRAKRADVAANLWDVSEEMTGVSYLS